ncbi:hypothetical protein NliqN6_3427 [Naganishia liquefaciens]|uniref:Uncharacterized protein n=1 Tax=Naganishia liquefaciens TaxID=104408 RepID=A0A8H3YEV9_9TREE|nr:hypothetical protein NliqN6_3427 [Naganishia liquefaciens]
MSFMNSNKRKSSTQGAPPTEGPKTSFRRLPEDPEWQTRQERRAWVTSQSNSTPRGVNRQASSTRSDPKLNEEGKTEREGQKPSTANFSESQEPDGKKLRGVRKSIRNLRDFVSTSAVSLLSKSGKQNTNAGSSADHPEQSTARSIQSDQMSRTPSLESIELTASTSWHP